MHGSTGLLADSAPLARRADLVFGDTVVSPSLRQVRGPLGVATLEPLVMQVLVALADARGAVMTRDALLTKCWPGQIVGDDALSRTISEIRRALRTTGATGFAIETIPKSGYRWQAEVAAVPVPETARETPGLPVEAPATPSRRTLLTAGAAILAAGGFAAWRLWPDPRRERAAELLTRGRQALRDEMPDSAAQGVGFLEQAVALDPANAAAWGALALARRNAAEYAEPAAIAAAIERTEEAAHRALAIDPRQGDALAALATLMPIFGDWTAAEARLRRVLAVAPANLAASDALSLLLMATGRVKARMPIADWLVAREPLSPVYQYHRAYGLWSNGRAAEADRAIARAFELWPTHPAVWFTRLWIFAFTGRAAAARNLVVEAQRRQGLPSHLLDILDVSMRALATHGAADVTAAIERNLQAARRGESLAVNAILILGALGAVDAAYDVARGYLLGRGPVVVDLMHAGGAPSINEQRRRKTMMLFVPPTAALRADPRFLPLCRDIGLVDYWRVSGTRPDFLGDRPLPA